MIKLISNRWKLSKIDSDNIKLKNRNTINVGWLGNTNDTIGPYFGILKSFFIFFNDNQNVYLHTPRPNIYAKISI